MSSTKCERFNFLLVVLGAAMATSFLVPSIERGVLYTYFIVIFLAHVHYGIGVVSLWVHVYVNVCMCVYVHVGMYVCVVCVCVCVHVSVCVRVVCGVWFADVHIYFQGSFASSKPPSIIYSIDMQFLAEDWL